MRATENKLISRRLQSNPTPSFLGFRAPTSGLRLTTDEWKLIGGGLSAYQHNQAYRPLNEKLTTQSS